MSIIDSISEYVGDSLEEAYFAWKQHKEVCKNYNKAKTCTSCNQKLETLVKAQKRFDLFINNEEI